MEDLKKRTEEYSEEQIRDARTFLDQLKKLPEGEIPVGRLLTIGFMNGLDAAQLAQQK